MSFMQMCVVCVCVCVCVCMVCAWCVLLVKTFNVVVMSNWAGGNVPMVGKESPMRPSRQQMTMETTHWETVINRGASNYRQKW